MDARSPFSGSPYAGGGYWDDVSRPAAARSPSFGARIARLVYGVCWALVFTAAVLGVLFVLYRNDLLLAAARNTDNEAAYLRWEKAVLGTPGWGTPRSVDRQDRPNLAALLPAPRVESERVETPAARAPTQAVSPRSEAADASTSEVLAIVSLDTLPVQPAPSKEPAPTRRTVASMPMPTPKASEEPPESSRVRRTAATRVAKDSQKAAAPSPAPIPGDNPLKAAIRSAVMKENAK
jgi:hypothetical protein